MAFTKVTDNLLSSGVGTGAGNILELDSNGKLPAVDGSNLTGIATSAGGGIGEFIRTSIAISSGDTALANESTTSNNSNIGILAGALNTNTTGQDNVAIGLNTLTDSNAHGNTAVGKAALNENTSGTYNTGVGFLSGLYNTSGSYNLGLGSYSLWGHATSKLTGSYNIGLGYQTGYALTTGQYNFLGGYQAGYSLTTASDNVYLGREAGYSHNGAGGSQIFIGEKAGKYSSGSGGGDIGIGRETCAGYSTGTGGLYNVGIQIGALARLAGGSQNVAIGRAAGDNITTGSNNLCLGAFSGDAITTGSNNVIIGDYAGTTSLADTVAIYAGTTERMKIDSTGLTVNGAAVGGGAMVFVSKTTISSAVSSVSITGIDTTYDRYVIKIQAKFASSTTFNVRYSQDNGSTFDSASNYDSMGDRNGGYLYHSQNAQGYLHVDSADWFIATLDLEPSVGWINGSTGGIRSGNRTANGHASVIISHRTLTSFDALQFFAGSGNISSGIITLYGIKDS